MGGGPRPGALGGEDFRAPKLAELVAERIRGGILSGDLAEGHRLPPEHEMVTAYGVSRGVVREGLRLLEAQGLVEIRRGNQGGALVTHRTDDLVRQATYIALKLKKTTFAEIYVATTNAESAAVRIATEQRPAQAAAAMRAQIEGHRLVLADLAAHTNALHRFRRTVIDNCGNPPLILVTSALFDLMADQMMTLLVLLQARVEPWRISLDRRAKLLDWHERLADLVERGDPDAAQAAWQRYQKVIGERLFAVIGDDVPLR